MAVIILAGAVVFIASSQVTLAKSPAPSILVDEASGEILAGNDENARWYPASLTKLMTAWVTFKAIADGEVEPGSPVVISADAARQPPTKMGFKRGTTLRVDTALKITIIKSANDVSWALAEAVAGSEEAFVGRMNKEAKRLGLVNTHYANSNGLFAADQYTSARDIAVLVHQIRTSFPQYAQWFATPAIQYGKKKYYSFNLLLERFPGTTGMKTGYICASGYNLAATATRKGRSLIVVVLGRSSQTDRAKSAAKLLSEGFDGRFSGKGNVDQVPAAASAKPANLRGQICTEAARKKLYNPLPQDAVVKSQYLEPRKVTIPPMKVVLGNVDAPPSKAWLVRRFMPKGKVPLPQKRPQFSFVGTAEDAQSAPAGNAISKELRQSLPVPAGKPKGAPASQ